MIVDRARTGHDAPGEGPDGRQIKELVKEVRSLAVRRSDQEGARRIGSVLPGEVAAFDRHLQDRQASPHTRAAPPLTSATRAFLSRGF
jgi:hypothetical protein